MKVTKTNTNIPGRRAGGAYEPCGKLWPNGEFSLGYAPCGGLERLESPKEYAEKWDAPLGLSMLSNSHSPRDDGKPKRGTKGLTSHGRRLLRNSIWAMQRVHTKKRLAFVTLTLPKCSFEQAWMVSSDWSRIVRVFFQKLGRYMRSQGLPSTYAACTEMQTKRVDSEGHPALHLHIVLVTKRRSTEGWGIAPGEIRWLWASVLGPLLPDVEFWGAVENVQRVRRDAGAYMSKYMSKGVGVCSPPRSDETGWGLPTSWYSLSLHLRQWVIGRIRVSPALMGSIEMSCRDGTMAAMADYVHGGVLEGCPGEGPHYFVGKIKGEFMDLFVQMWRCLVDIAA